MKKIDVHCHLYPKEYVEEVKKRNLFTTHSLPEWKSAEDRIAVMDRFGIERQVLSPSSPFTYFEDDGLNLYLSRAINGLMLGICSKYPDRFSGFINVPLCNVKQTIDELKHFIKARGILGVSVGANIHGKPLVSPEFAPFWDEVNRLSLPVMIHPVSPIGIDNVGEYKDFYRSVGFLWETTMAVGRMALSGFFDSYPNITFILSHLGGALPFVYTSMDMCQKRNPTKEFVPSRPLSEYFRRLYVDSARLLTVPILTCAIDLYGEKGIMFGSDIPFACDVTQLNIPRIEGFDISEQLRQKILYENAKRLLKL